MQVAVSDLNRTCVTTCEAGQFGNPYTHKCSNYTLECPDGFYADSNTRMCERSNYFFIFSLLTIRLGCLKLN